MRKDLNGYSIDFHQMESITNESEAAECIQAFDELDELLGFKGGIVCVDEKGNVSINETDHFVLDLPDDISKEKFEKAKKVVARILEKVGATRDDLDDILARDPQKETL